MNKKYIGLLLGAIGFGLPFLATFPGLSLAGHLALSIFFMAAVFWIFEPVPIYATSLFVIFLQVMLLSKEGLFARDIPAAESYTEFIGTLANPIIILFLGGFILADAAVKYSLDRTITAKVLSPFGNKPSFVLLGLIAVTALLSAFMSNTATTAMMMTVILPVVTRLPKNDPFKFALILSIPFAANLGGMATPIGTPPNAVVIGALEEQGVSLAFTDWMILAVPFTLVMLLALWLLLLVVYKPTVQSIETKVDVRLDKSPKALLFYAVFMITLLLWISESIHSLKSGMVALFPVAALTLTGVLTKEDIRKLPWEVLWLVAGGISLGISMKNTNLAEWMVASVPWPSFSVFFLVAVFSLVAVLMSTFLSNTVTASLLVPLAVSLSVSGVFDGVLSLLTLSLVIGLSCSIAMVLPISTPPNAIASSTGMIETDKMARSGILIGILGIICVILFARLFWPIVT